MNIKLTVVVHNSFSFVKTVFFLIAMKLFGSNGVFSDGSFYLHEKNKTKQQKTKAQTKTKKEVKNRENFTPLFAL